MFAGRLSFFTCRGLMAPLEGEVAGDDIGDDAGLSPPRMLIQLWGQDWGPGGRSGPGARPGGPHTPTRGSKP